MKLPIALALNACSMGDVQMPVNGLIVIPTYPNGNWTAFCATSELARTLMDQLQGEIEMDEEVPVFSFKAGNVAGDTVALKQTLSGHGYEVDFANTPPWEGLV